jgi:queuine/archaeosine tRNA-ribosyltransferase
VQPGSNGDKHSQLFEIKLEKIVHNSYHLVEAGTRYVPSFEIQIEKLLYFSELVARNEHARGESGHVGVQPGLYGSKNSQLFEIKIEKTLPNSYHVVEAGTKYVPSFEI